MKKIHSVVWKEGNLYVAKALEVEVASQGKSGEQALKNLKEALELYFEDTNTTYESLIKQPKLQDISIFINA